MAVANGSSRMRVDSGGIGGMSIVSSSRDGARIRVDSGIGGMPIELSSRDGRIRVDSGVSGMGIGGILSPTLPAAAAAAANDGEDDRVSPRTTRDRLLIIPRTIASILMYPLRVLEAGVNDWATENYDAVFLRQFMERLEAEREAAMESPEEREARLKEAFAQACMVWELDEENFIPPSPLFELSDVVGGKGTCGKSDAVVKSIIDNIDNEVGYGLYSLGESNENSFDDVEGSIVKDERADQEINITESDLDVEKGNIKDEHATETNDDVIDAKDHRINYDQVVRVGDDSQTKSGCNDCDGETKGPKQAHYQSLDAVGEGMGPSRNGTVTDNNCISGDLTSMVDGDVTAGVYPENVEHSHDCTRTSPVTTVDAKATDTNHEAMGTEPSALDATDNENATANATIIADQPSSSPPDTVESATIGNRPRAVSAPALPSGSMEEDTFNAESTPVFLYLNTARHKRRGRCNTGSSHGTDVDVSSSNQSRLANGESMESIATASSSSLSTILQDSHKIPNECAICLCEYEKGDTIVTSCDSECPHAFHQECIVEWLVKMQEGTPCPCCRRQFVELDGVNNHPRNNVNTNNINNATVNNAATDAAQNPEEAERLRQDRRRQHIELGIRRGRAFNMAAISLRPSSLSGNTNAVSNGSTAHDAEGAAQLRLERRIQDIELGIRRGGRAMNTSVISLW